MDTLLDGIHPDWIQFFSIKENKAIFAQCLKELGKVIMKKKIICPPQKDVFRVFKMSPKDVKVVILGQDPYHGEGEATGLCFSVNMGIAIPPSLQAIYRALANYNLISEMPKHGCLNNWAIQGVFMLNSSLTTELNEPGAHPWWHEFTDIVISHICDINEKVVFLLWGKDAQKKKPLISDNHVILESQHPSPMANARIEADKRFDRCDHFAKVNKILTKPIDWNPTAVTGVFTDGSCIGNGKKDATGGWGVYFTSGPLKDTKKYGPISIYKDEKGTLYKRTNVRAEMTAIIEALDIYIENRVIGHLVMYVDNEMCVNILNAWLDRWVKEKRVDSMKNPDLLHMMIDRTTRLKEMLGPFTFKAQHVYAHLEKKGGMPEKGTKEYKIWKFNHTVDELANMGARMCVDTDSDAEALKTSVTQQESTFNQFENKNDINDSLIEIKKPKAEPKSAKATKIPAKASTKASDKASAKAKKSDKKSDKKLDKKQKETKSSKKKPVETDESSLEKSDKSEEDWSDESKSEKSENPKKKLASDKSKATKKPEASKNLKKKKEIKKDDLSDFSKEDESKEDKSDAEFSD